jgi:hypothetical protein
MNAEVFAGWLLRQGYKIYRTASSYWFNAGPRVLQAFPYHWLITPDGNELNSLMLKNNIIALRYSAPPDYSEGKISYHIVLSKCYNMDNLKSQARNGIRCGLKHFTVENVSFERLATEGWELQKETLARQNRLKSMTHKQWELLCSSAEDLAGFEVFAAISQGKLAAAVIVCNIDGLYSVPYAMSISRFLRYHVNNALFYSICCELLGRENSRGVFFTVESLDAEVHVDEFKLRMGFEPQVVRQNVIFHPFLRPFITSALYSINHKLFGYYPANPLLAKADGMLRFYLEGRRPAKEQNLPGFLKNILNFS